jgi:hypothetical protein
MPLDLAFLDFPQTHPKLGLGGCTPAPGWRKPPTDTNSKNEQVAKSLYPPKKDKEFKLKGGVKLARKCDHAEISDDDVCYALVCMQTLFSLDNIASSIPPVATNLLQEYEDIFSSEIPPGLPPMRGVEHQIDLIPSATLPNRAAYRTNPEETKEIQRQV